MDKKALSNFFSKYKITNQIFHELMQFRIRDILLVATVYDAYIIEQEGSLTEKVFGEYSQLTLSNAPRITSVTCGEEAIEKLQNNQFQLIILTMRVDEINAFKLSEKIKDLKPDIPILLLLNDNSEISFLSEYEEELENIDRVFVWNSDPKTLLAMNKYIEDKKNVVNDTQVGKVRVILLVEDSIRYYSRYLPILYTEIIKQVQSLVSQEYEGSRKLLRMRARPKVLLANNYEEAIHIFNKYKKKLLCVITDVSFPKNGEQNNNAGFDLIKHIKQHTVDLPALVQSSETDAKKKAKAIEAHFINKNSETLAQELTDFILNQLGFGSFCFRDENGKPVAVAKNLKEFEKILQTIPAKTLIYHASRQHFSTWLMARGEIAIAERVQSRKTVYLSQADELRKYLIKIGREVYYQQTEGRVVPFEEDLLTKTGRVIKLAEGALGGKGRGIAFLNLLLHHTKLDNFNKEVNIKIPKTAIIGTEEFERFCEYNDINKFLKSSPNYKKNKKKFLQGKLSKELKKKLKIYLQYIKTPIAVRSSGLFEDSISQPFSGIYNTFLLPNNHKNFATRLQQLKDAIKLVFACIYSPLAQSYFEAINYKTEEEKMAVILQEVVGQQIEDRYYPNFSGVAHSYNYYPYSYLKPEDGIAALALGLGHYIVDGGGKAYTFSPNHPKLDIYEAKSLLRHSQTSFYAIDMSKMDLHLDKGEDATLQKYSMEQAEKDGMLNYIASVWDAQNEIIQPGLNVYGPRIINFAYILKYNLFPLADILKKQLRIMTAAMGTPVEIEFTVDLNKDSNKKRNFYLLQIKHLLRDIKETKIDVSSINKKNLVLFTDKCIGNGKLEEIYDIVYVPPKKFERDKTIEMAEEIEFLNAKLKKAKRKYILLGNGRWGSSDRWLGIPAKWPQICNAKVIVEYGLDGFEVDASMGSHFFHNVTTFNVGYFYIPFSSKTSFVDWNWLNSMPVTEETKHFNHIHFDKTLTTIMDGKKQIAVIYKTV